MTGLVVGEGGCEEPADEVEVVHVWERGKWCAGFGEEVGSDRESYEGSEGEADLP